MNQLSVDTLSDVKRSPVSQVHPPSIPEFPPITGAPVLESFYSRVLEGFLKCLTNGSFDFFQFKGVCRREYNKEQAKNGLKWSENDRKRFQTVTTRDLWPTVGHPTASGRHIGNKGSNRRLLLMVENKIGRIGRGIKDGNNEFGSIEQLKRRARARSRIEIRLSIPLLSLSFPSLIVFN
ncbi:hypothetical protein M9H77_06951 [Catharanthus roseus]|uniref:Uncharacterized protein n=1 Tax=Catharanthus roseus TaxID=4058 RepID=A0ACC0BTT4_CATRO|nr:hypothetical protein M9H77_06951 [Catharanthus roseus]